MKLIAIQNNIQIVVDYNQIVIRLIGSIDKVELARIDVLLFFDHLVMYRVYLTSNHVKLTSFFFFFFFL